MKEALIRTTLVLMTVAIFCGGIYGIAKFGRIISYKWWYQDMVQQTVRGMVKDSALK